MNFQIRFNKNSKEVSEINLLFFNLNSNVLGKSPRFLLKMYFILFACMKIYIYIYYSHEELIISRG